MLETIDVLWMSERQPLHTFTKKRIMKHHTQACVSVCHTHRAFQLLESVHDDWNAWSVWSAMDD